jgi:hypothetical protein
MADKNPMQPFNEPITQIVAGFKVTSAIHRTDAGQEAPVVVLQLHVVDDGLQPVRRFATNLRVDQEMVDSMAEKFAQMAGMSRAAFAEHQLQGEKKAREG